MSRSEEGGRYFLAAWPDTTVRARLAEWSEDVRADPSARRIPGANLHMTIVFLGMLDAPRLDAVRTVAGAVNWPGASLVIDRIGYWKRSRIIWAGSRDGSAALTVLADDLRDRLRRLGFRVDERAFVPHVTLYRKARRRPRWQSRAVDWRIDELCLVASNPTSAGARYEVLDRWSAHGDMK